MHLERLHDVARFHGHARPPIVCRADQPSRTSVKARNNTRRPLVSRTSTIQVGQSERSSPRINVKATLSAWARTAPCSTSSTRIDRVRRHLRQRSGSGKAAPRQPFQLRLHTRPRPSAGPSSSWLNHAHQRCFVPVVFYSETEPMHPQPQQMPVDARRTEAEAVAAAYRTLRRGDDRAALLAVVTDALADLDAARRQVEAQARQVSRGYVRAISAGR
jgi:hypothetical protein